MADIDFMNLTFFLFLLLLLLPLFFILTVNSNSNKLPPGPKPLPVIGNLLNLGDKPHKSLAKLAKFHGPLMTLKLGQITSIVISSSAMAKEILQINDQYLSNRTIPDALKAHNHHEAGLPWIPLSPLWKTLRKICNYHLFAGKILDANQNLRREKVEEMISNVRKTAMNGEAVDIGRLSFVTSLNLLSNTIFSVDLADETDSEMAKEFKKTVRMIMEEAGKANVGDYFPVLKKMDIQGIRRRMIVHMGKVLNLLDAMIDQRKKEEKMNPNFVSKNDLLHFLLNNEEITDVRINKQQMQHLLLVLFVAGSDTTSSTLQWAMAELLKNPEKLSKAQTEIRKVLGKNNPFKESDISNLPYLQAVVKETTRLHPVVPLLLPRKAEKEVEIAGFIIPKDAQVLVNAWAIGRDPSIWENPDSFEPERFMEDMKIGIGGRNSFDLIPFGGGRRICPGLPLAMRMLHLILGSLIHFFDWKVEDGIQNIDMDDKFGVTLDMLHPLKAIPLLL